MYVALPLKQSHHNNNISVITGAGAANVNFMQTLKIRGEMARA